MPSAEYDLRYLEAGLLDLQGYLLSQELYWPIGATAPHGEAPYPRLTLGGLLMTRASLHARPLTSDQQERLNQMEEKMESTHSHWKTAWEQKATRELSARLKLWRDFVEDYRENPGENVDRYAYEIRRRVMLDLLQEQIHPAPAAEAEMISGLDNLLHAVFIPGSFIWDRELEGVFPARRYWYLYGRLKDA